MGQRQFDLVPAPERFGQIPRQNGILFQCPGCGRRTATTRDAALRTWGERGSIADAAKRLRCRNCRRRGLMAYLAPAFAKMGSPTPLDRLVATIRSLIVSGKVD